MRTLIERFNSVNSLKISLETEIEDTEFVIKEYSNLLGESPWSKTHLRCSSYSLILLTRRSITLAGIVELLDVCPFYETVMVDFLFLNISTTSNNENSKRLSPAITMISSSIFLISIT